MKRKELRQLIRECLTEMMGIDDDDPMDIPRDKLFNNFDTFTKGYFEAALATSTDNRSPSGGEPLDKNYTYEDFHIDTLQRMQKDCKLFQDTYGEYIEKLGIDEDEAGKLFWLSRNRHGTGFWDVYWEDESEDESIKKKLLHKAAVACGPYDLYFANSGRWDGLIFGYPT